MSIFLEYLTRAVTCIVLLLTCLYSSAYQHYGKHQHEQETKQTQDLPQVRVNIPNLEPSHYQFWLRNHPLAQRAFQKICESEALTTSSKDTFVSLHANLTLEDSQYLSDLQHGQNVLRRICDKISVVSQSCWGYEVSCSHIYLMPECESLPSGKSEHERKIDWFNEADFGYVLKRRQEMVRYCKPPPSGDNETSEIRSTFECTKFFRTCRATDIMLRLPNKIPTEVGTLILDPYTSLIKKGDVGGWNCDLQLQWIPEQNGQRGALQSWYADLEHYSLLNGDPKSACDVTVEKPVLVVKLDAPTNMYHYFCNFVNIYSTLHLYNRFTDDIEIVVWDNHLPRSNFEPMWSVFSRHPLRGIKEFEGKRVCFKRAIFTLLPRMVQGLYYNTPLSAGCSKSGLFHAFNTHTLHKLGVKQQYQHDDTSSTVADSQQLRVLIVSRSEPHRRILNEDALKIALANDSKRYTAKFVDLSRMPFKQQLELTHNTDILVGMHGAGLTHVLFLPDWAALVELHDCADASYRDLARLRGVKYFTLGGKRAASAIKRVPIERAPDELRKLHQEKLADHDKFSNYEIEPKPFLELIDRAADHVLKARARVHTNEDTQDKKSDYVLERPKITTTISSDVHDEL